MINIPSISDRQHRPCDTCVWEDCEYGCQAWERLGYKVAGERDDWSIELTYKQRAKLPCRFHMTSDELKMILDPYFME